MQLSKLFSSVSLASMVAMTTIVASPKPQAASAQLASENSIILVNSGEKYEREIPTTDRLVVSDIPEEPVWKNPDIPVVSVEVPQDYSDLEKLSATVAKTVEKAVENSALTQESDGFKVFRSQETEQKEPFSIRIKSPEEIFQSFSFYILIGFILLILAVMFFVEVLKFIIWIILLPLKILLSLFR